VITQNRLREVLDYDPKSGKFTWLITSGRAFVGQEAGTLCNGYVRIKVEGRSYRAHRLAFLYMTGKIPVQVDHKDMNRSNNSWGNLRDANNTLNNANRKKQPNNTSGYKGVSWFSPRNKWRALITKNGKTKHLGLFNTAELAAQAYEIAATTEFGEYARV